MTWHAREISRLSARVMGIEVLVLLAVLLWVSEEQLVSRSTKRTRRSASARYARGPRVLPP